MLADIFRSLSSQNETCLGNRLKTERLGWLSNKNLPEECNRGIAAEDWLNKLECLSRPPFHDAGLPLPTLECVKSVVKIYVTESKGVLL